MTGVQTCALPILVFIGAKIFWNQIHGKLDPAISLSVTFSLLAIGVAYSLYKTRTQAAPTAS